MLHLSWANLLLPLDATPAPKGVDPDKVQPGLLGFGFFVVLATAVVLLVMSMRRHLGRIDVTRHQQDKLTQAAAAAKADGKAAAAAAAAAGTSEKQPPAAPPADGEDPQG